ncbi:fibronectin type III domain-containing protein [Geomonas subterranea]|uniref:Fibronectin type III domain-containing protein n=1 Tax=Geomonas subterranea TaxID=2847989 RepID=A0ABX8LJZ1_9BACT|nr:MULTISPECIES: fibronectin type III domain-containing protein [Geomonas]QXE91676.1 fibronectin type III domain-containing protein [Geomonas subterranea]QXM10230.1 fibronectin type III domain-containing protein [Geomonas subterranea]
MSIDKVIITFPSAIVAFIELVRRVLVSLTGNPNFPEPWVGCSLAELSGCLEKLQQAHDEAKYHDSLKVKYRNQVKSETKRVLRNIANYVQLIAAGNVQALQSSGFDFQKERRSTKAGRPLTPEVQLRHGERRCTIWVKAKALPGAGSYEVQVSNSDPNLEANWAAYCISKSCSKIIISDLVSGQNYWVRIRGIFSFGAGEWSVPVTIMSL